MEFASIPFSSLCFIAYCAQGLCREMYFQDFNNFRRAGFIQSGLFFLSDFEDVSSIPSVGGHPSELYLVWHYPQQIMLNSAAAYQ
jgi:hypothetical protein